MYGLHQSSLISVSIRGVNSLLAFSISAILARTLGSAEFGGYVFALTIIMLLSVPLFQALSTISVREIASGRVPRGADSLKCYFRWADRLTFGYVAIISIVLGGAAVFRGLRRENGLEDLGILLIGAGLILTMGFYGSRGAAIRGLGYDNLGQFPDTVMRPGVLAASVAVVAALGLWTGFDSRAVMALHALAGLCASIFAVIALRHVVNWEGGQIKSERDDAPPTGASLWTRAFMPFYGLALLQIANISVDVIILGIFHSDTQVGIYRIAGQLAGLVSFGLLAINPVLSGRISKSYAERDINALQNIASTGVRYMVAIAGLPFFLLLIFGRQLLEFVYGDVFTTGYPALQILLFAQLINVAFGSVAALLNMTGHEKDTLLGMFVALSSNFVLCFALVPAYGLIGAAIANCVATICWNALLYHRVRRRLHVDSSIFGAFSR